jgi:hypothetical protein
MIYLAKKGNGAVILKKAIVAVTGVILTGGILGMSYFIADEKPDETVEAVEAVSAEAETKQSEPLQKTPLTERTVDTGGEYPWNFMDANDLKVEIEKGGQAYLMSDAEALEKQALGFLDNPVGYQETIVANYAAFGRHFQNFVTDLSEYYPENQAYFLKISEAAIALENNRPEDAAAKLREAQTLRK